MKRSDSENSMESEPLIKSPQQENMDIRSGLCPKCQKNVQFIKGKAVNHSCVLPNGSKMGFGS
jgi:hypothetical protein